MKRTFTLHNPQQGHQVLTERIWPHIKSMTMAGHRLVVTVAPETRSTEQNAKLWATLTDVSEQVVWHGRRLTPTEWKHVFSASLARQDVVPGIDGGFVVLGKSTSDMSRAEMSDLIDLIHAFGAQRGVVWSDATAEAVPC